MTLVFGTFLLSMMVLVAIAIVREHNLFVAVMLSAIFSLLMATNLFLLDAADVALTEAAIGAGISTVLALGALALTAEAEQRHRPKYRWLSIAIMVLALVALLYSTQDNPRIGDPEAPVHQHVAPWYLEQTPILIDIPNVVTAVLGSFRGYDTFGEVLVILTAGIGVLFLLSAGRNDLLPNPHRIPDNTIRLRQHTIPHVIGKLLAPFIILFGLYVQFHGEYGPGGGFQAGALIAAGVILYGLVEGERPSLALVPPNLLYGLSLGGVLLYGGVGIASMLLGGNFLDYSVLMTDPIAGQHWGLLLIELGVGMTVTGVLLSIYHAFAARDPH